MPLLSSLRRPAAGAVLGQVTQALAGLVLQVAAARYLGAAGFALFALGYGLVVLVTGVCSGLVGDSLTVLDRADAAIRAGLHGWTAVVSIGAGLLGAAAAVLTGALPLWAGLLAGAATAAYLVEDTLRRLLMASGRFWSLPAVDGASLLLALGTLITAGLVTRLNLTAFVLALLVAQSGAALVAWWLLPVDERPRGPWRGAAWRAVVDFGIWRAAAQAIRPGTLTVLRILVLATVGAAAYGPLEAARVFTAPALVVVAGLGSFLLPHFVARRARPADETLRVADRVAVGLAGAVAAIGLLACALVPWLGPAVTGGAYEMPVLAVAGWAAYAAAGAVLLPYSAMATVHRRHRRVLLLRCTEFGALGVVLALVVLVDGGELWAPMALAVGPLLAAAAVRTGVLLPVVRRQHVAGAAAQPVPA